MKAIIRFLFMAIFKERVMKITFSEELGYKFWETYTSTEGYTFKYLGTIR